MQTCNINIALGSKILSRFHLRYSRYHMPAFCKNRTKLIDFIWPIHVWTSNPRSCKNANRRVLCHGPLLQTNARTFAYGRNRCTLLYNVQYTLHTHRPIGHTHLFVSRYLCHCRICSLTQKNNARMNSRNHCNKLSRKTGKGR